MLMQNATRFDDAAPVMPRLATGLPLSQGFAAVTLVESATGWVPAGALRPGDLVHTFDGGLRPLLRVERHHLASARLRLVRLPGGAFHGADDILLVPGQFLLVDTPHHETCMMGLVAAEAAIGLCGAHWFGMTQSTEIVSLVFAEDEVVHANGGQLLHCPGAGTGDLGQPHDPYFTALPLPEARALLAGWCGDTQQAA